MLVIGEEPPARLRPREPLEVVRRQRRSRPRARAAKRTTIGSASRCSRATRSSRSTGASASCAPLPATNCNTTSSCSPPAPTRSCRRIAGRDAHGLLRVPHDRRPRGDPRLRRRARRPAWSSAAACSGWRRPMRCSRSGSTTHVVEFAPRLMPLQVDEVGGARPAQPHRGARGQRAHRRRRPASRRRRRRARARAALRRRRASSPIDMVVFSAGIRPRDDLARAAGLAIGERGGIVIDDACRTSRPRHLRDRRVRAVRRQDRTAWSRPATAWPRSPPRTLAGDEQQQFEGFDMSTKLKLLGVDVGSFGDAFGKTPGAKSSASATARRRLQEARPVSADKKQLLGGVLVGDASAYIAAARVRADRDRAARAPRRPDRAAARGRQAGRPRRRRAARRGA